MKTANIILSSVVARDKLAPRSEVYFQSLGKGRALGYRRPSTTAIGTWRARYLAPGSTKQQHKPLGDFADLPPAARFGAAKRAAEAWFDHLSGGGVAQVYTVKEVCDRYVARLAEDKKWISAQNTRQFFAAFVENDEVFANTPVAVLTASAVERWRKRLQATPLLSGRSKGQPRSAQTLNRNMAPVRAALNRALTDKLCASNAAWLSALTDLPTQPSPRKGYIERADRAALIASAPPDFARFLDAMSRLPLRPGTMAKLRVRDFDSKTGMLNIGIDDDGVLIDKAHRSRTIGLTPETRDFFTRQCDGLAPEAPLLAQANGQAWGKDTWKHPFRAVCRSVGLPDSTVMYTLRHSTISDLCKIAPAIEVARMAGTSVAEIDKTYFQSRPEHQAKYLRVLSLDGAAQMPVAAPAPSNEVATLRAEIESLRARLEALAEG